MLRELWLGDLPKNHTVECNCVLHCPPFSICTCYSCQMCFTRWHHWQGHWRSFWFFIAHLAPIRILDSTSPWRDRFPGQLTSPKILESATPISPDFQNTWNHQIKGGRILTNKLVFKWQLTTENSSSLQKYMSSYLGTYVSEV